MEETSKTMFDNLKLWFTTENLTIKLHVLYSSLVQLCLNLCDPMGCSMPGLPGHHQLPEFTQTRSIELVMPFNHLIFCHPFSSHHQSFLASGLFK